MPQTDRPHGEKTLPTELGPWVTADNQLEGAVARLLVGQDLGDSPGWEAKPVVVAPMGWRWMVLLRPGLADSVQSNLASPTRDVACAYADDFLYRAGFTGPGVQPLPAHLPPLRERQEVLVPWNDGPGAERAAKCECGHVGVELLDRHCPCPECGGQTMILAEDLAALDG